MIKNLTKNHYFASFLKIGIFGFACPDDVIKSHMPPYLSQYLIFFFKFLFVCVEEMPSFNLTLESDKSIQKWLIPEGRVLATSPLVNDVVEKGLVNEGLRTIRCFCHDIQNAVILQCICIWWRHVFLKNQSLSIFFCTLETSHF